MVRGSRRYRRGNSRPPKFFTDFIEGISLGIGVVVTELFLFAFKTMMDAITKISVTLPQTTESAQTLSYFSWITLLLIGAGILHHFLLGVFESEIVSVGFLLGDFLVLYFTWNTIWNISPDIVIGMVVAFVIVLIGFLIRLLSNTRTPSNDYYW